MVYDPLASDGLGLGVTANMGETADLRYLDDQFAGRQEPA